VMKNGIKDLGMKSPLYLPGPVEPHYGPGRYLTFEGFSVDEHGKQVSFLHLSKSWIFRPHRKKRKQRDEMLTCITALHGRNSRIQTNNST
jgi:hypothetical protein